MRDSYDDRARVFAGPTGDWLNLVSASCVLSRTVPVCLGDALQLRCRAGDMFAEHNVTIQIGD